MSRKSNMNGFVLAGGQSRRFGDDKALLVLDGQPLVLRAVNLLKAYVDTTTVLGPKGRYDFIGVPVIPDRRPGQGPLAAILNGLENSGTDWNLFLACDLPLLNGRFVEMLLRLTTANQADAVVPRTGGRWHPVCAAYHRTCISPVRRQLEGGEAALKDLLPHLCVEAITSERLAADGLTDDIFENVNLREDWRRLLRKVRVRP